MNFSSFFLENNSEVAGVSLAGRMKFLEFDVNKVIQNGSNLLACESTKVDFEEQTGRTISCINLLN